MKRHTYRLTTAVLLVSLLIPAALAWGGGGTTGEFRLVEQTGATVVEVSGMLTERTPEGEVNTPCDAMLTIMLTEAETKDIRVTKSGQYEESEVFWDNWHPYVKGVIAIHRAAGDEFVPVEIRGITRFLGVAYDTWRMAEFSIEGYVSGAAGDYGLGAFRLSLTNYMSNRFEPNGAADLWMSGVRCCALSGTYRPGTKADLADLKSGIGAVREKGALQKYHVEGEGMRVVAALTGYLREYDPATGGMVSLPAEGEITMTLPSSREGNGVRYTWTDEAGGGEGYYLQLTKTGTMHITLTISRPAGEEVLHMAVPGGYSASMEASRSAGELFWNTRFCSSYLSPLHLSGQEHGFVKAAMDWWGTSIEKLSFAGAGGVWMRLTGFEQTLFLMGNYVTTK